MSGKSRTVIWATFSAALFFLPVAASAQTLPAFTTNIVPIGLSLAIVDKQVTTKAGTTESATFTINTGFTGTDFTDDLIDLIASGGTFEVGVAPNGSCTTGETILPPISIPMGDVTHTLSSGNDMFAFTSADLSADWTISPVMGTSSGGASGQGVTVTCNNGVCTTTSGGTGTTIINNNDGSGPNTSVTCINGDCTTSTGGSGTSSVNIQNSNVGGSGGATPTDQMTFKASATTGGIIPLPGTAVDVFFLLLPNPSGPLDGGCITLHSFSVNNQTQNAIGKTTVTRTYSAH
jgi:hypothetical protein